MAHVLAERGPRSMVADMKRSFLWTAALLGFVGGFVDAAGYLGLGGLFTSHVTGNLAVLGARLARQQTHNSGVVGVAFIPIFAASVALAGLIARASRRRGLDDAAALLFFEAATLAVTGWAGYAFSDALAHSDALAIGIVGAMAVVGMGTQNGMMRESFGGHAPTTVMTSNVTQLSLSLLDWVQTPRAASEQRQAVIARVRKYSSSLAGFVLGAAAGAFLEHSLGLGSLFVPATLLLSLAALHLVRPEPATA